MRKKTVNTFQELTTAFRHLRIVHLSGIIDLADSRQGHLTKMPLAAGSNCCCRQLQR